MGAELRHDRGAPPGLARVQADVQRALDAGEVRLPKPRSGATRPRRAGRGRVDANTVKPLSKNPEAVQSRLAHRVETAIAFRLHNALGTQNERYFVAVNPTAHSLACLRIGVFVTADAARLATGVGGSPFTGRVSHPLDGEQSFMTSPHRHSPLTSLAWSHHATTPRAVAGGPCALTRWCVARGGGLARCAWRRRRSGARARGASPVPAVPDRRRAGRRRRAVPARG